MRNVFEEIMCVSVLARTLIEAHFFLFLFRLCPEAPAVVFSCAQGIQIVKDRSHK